MFVSFTLFYHSFFVWSGWYKLFELFICHKKGSGSLNRDYWLFHSRSQRREGRTRQTTFVRFCDSKDDDRRSIVTVSQVERENANCSQSCCFVSLLALLLKSHLAFQSEFLLGNSRLSLRNREQKQRTAFFMSRVGTVGIGGLADCMTLVER